MKLLAVDTSSLACSVALSVDGKPAEVDGDRFTVELTVPRGVRTATFELAYREADGRQHQQPIEC